MEIFTPNHFPTTGSYLWAVPCSLCVTSPSWQPTQLSLTNAIQGRNDTQFAQGLEVTKREFWPLYLEINSPPMAQREIQTTPRVFLELCWSPRLAFIHVLAFPVHLLTLSSLRTHEKLGISFGISLLFLKRNIYSFLRILYEYCICITPPSYFPASNFS